MADASEVIVPPVLYLPVLERQGARNVVAVHPLADGRNGLLAYTALDRLAAQCGSEQPWLLVWTSDLGRIKDEQPFDVIAFDIEVPPSLRAGERLA